MAIITAAQKSALQAVYLAYFNRPAEPDGYDSYLKIMSDRLDLKVPFQDILDTIATNFAKSPEAQKDYPFLKDPIKESPETFLLAVYKNAFNRTEPTTSDGFKFWMGRITDKDNPLEPGLALLKIMAGATPGDTDSDILNNKTTAAQEYTTKATLAAAAGSFEYTDAAKAAAKAWIGGVDGTDASVTNALASADGLIKAATGTAPDAPDAPEIVGVTINLTADTDVVSPNQANPAFKSTADADTINAPAGTFTSNTSIDGGGSTDSILAIRTTSGTVTPTLSNVEKLFVTAQSGGTQVDLSNATGLTEVWSKDTNFSAGVTFVDFFNIKVGTNIGVEGTGDNIFLWDNSAAPGSIDQTTLFVKQATDNRIGIDKDINTVNLEVEGASSLQFLAGGFESAFSTMNVAGTGNLTLNAMPNTIRVFDASGLNGSVTAPDMHSTNGVKITGSAQVDTFALLSTNGAMDTIVYNGSNVSTTSSRDTYTGFDSGTATTFEDKIDVSAFGITTGKATISTFNSEPTEGASFSGNAVAKLASNTIYVDINSDGVFNSGSDLVINITGAATANLDVSDFIF